MNRLNPGQIKNIPAGKVLTGDTNGYGTVGDIIDRVQVPNTAFAVPTKPTIAEVRTWVDANLSAAQKVNSILYTIATEQVFQSNDSYSQMNFSNSSAGGTDVFVNQITVNTVNYPLNVRFTSGTSLDFDPNELISAINTAISATGIAFTLVGNSSSSSFFIFQMRPISGQVNVTVRFSFSNGTNSNQASSTFTAGTPSLTTPGSTSERPDKVYQIIADNLSEIDDRPIYQNTWFIDSSVPDSSFAQKGNPLRPFKTNEDLVSLMSGDITDGDIFYYMPGIHVNNVANTRANVTHYFAEGAVYESDAGNLSLFNITSGNLNIQGKGVFKSAFPGTIRLQGSSTTFNIECLDMVNMTVHVEGLTTDNNSIKVRNWTSSGNGNNDGGLNFLNADTGGATNAACHVHLDIDYFQDRKFIPHQGTVGVKVTGRIGHLRQSSVVADVSDRPGILLFTPADVNLSNARFDLRIDKISFDQGANKSHGFFTYGNTNPRTFTNNRYRFSIGPSVFDATNDARSFASIFPSGSLDLTNFSGNELYIEFDDFDITNSNLNPPVATSGLFDKVTITGKVKSNQTILTIPFGTDTVINNATLTTNTANALLSATTIGNYHVHNSSLINNGTVAAVISTNAGNLYTTGSRTNSTVTDAEVTEVGTAMLKNANVV